MIMRSLICLLVGFVLGAVAHRWLEPYEEELRRIVRRLVRWY